MGGVPASATSPEAGVTWDDLLSACVHCGFCVPACPTWDVLREENDSPRGRLYLMRAEAEGRVQAAGAFSLHIERCLGCRACETVCPAGVPYGRLLEEARTRVPAGAAARVAGDLLLDLLTDPGRSRRLYGAARFLRRTGVARLLGRVLPGVAGRALRLLEATRPVVTTTEMASPPPSGSPSPSLDAEPYALLEGCVMQGLFGHVHAATRRVLDRAGYGAVEAEEQTCCGALHAHAGRLARARDLARANIAAFEAHPGAWIVTDSAGCGAALRDYPAWLEGDPEWHARAVGFAERVRDVTELLANLGEAGGGDQSSGSAPPRLEGRVGYDAPCHLVHGQGVRDEPLAVLRSVEGLRVEALPSSDKCCGGAGLYGFTQPELAESVAASKRQEIATGEFDWIATGNPGCIMTIGAGLRGAGIPTRVVHPVELLDLAWWGRHGDTRRPAAAARETS